MIHNVGDILPDASIVFWVDETGQHGMAAQRGDAINPNDNSEIMSWYVAKEVADHYGPAWHLPSKHELNLLYLQKDVVGGFTDNYYWTSTDYHEMLAWYQIFTSGRQIYTLKANTHRVRAVRGF